MKKTLMALLALLVFLAPLYLCAADGNTTDGVKHKITVDQAWALVLASLTPEQRRLPNLQFLSSDKDNENISSYEEPKNPRFLTFNVIWDGTPDGSIEVGFFDVDVYTGDVFSGTAGCYEYKNKKLEALQKQVRRSLHLTQTAYQKLKTEGPMC
ncbi:MAG: hypothetical protein LBQ20_12610 [Rhodanobacter sp.]|jgi:hypothetical protein|nr:hypothetical protein [Rhodanobacter sp.]